jgi:hypothetical protein
MNTDIFSSMIKLNGELAKVVSLDKPYHEINIILQSEKTNNLQESLINLSHLSDDEILDEIFEGRELTCKKYILFLKKHFFFENEIYPKTTELKSRPSDLLNRTIKQANKDNIFLKDLNEFNYMMEFDKLLTS